ncbi:MAG TPA: TIM barrel protein [Candidatus Corynebacterium gallistercoris]|uniref:TIM barrel protein n=1 Tax=Candidatus Corynebacterium gallistercoris TaxID=2838530 RepID=A0A9D1S1K0_9CORY|nr:TIM barrel protein [Candidatus Corynebacterium gallistercoris]
MRIHNYLTGVNCSIGWPHWSDGLDAARAEGWNRVELWWPFTTPEPARADIAELTAHLRRHDLQLVAMNMWAGDMAAGERGVLHREPLAQAHLDAVAFISDATRTQLFNLVVGRGGAQILDEQQERFAEAAQWITQRTGGQVLAEPLSGMDDYPIRTVAEAQALLQGAESGGLLLDLYHLAARHTDECGPGWLEDPTEMGRWFEAEVASPIKTTMPLHAQVADVPGRGEPGTGRLPLAKWAEALRALGYAGDVMGEWTKLSGHE